MKKGQISKNIAFCALWAFIVLCMPILPSSALAAASVCAEVKLEIRQELTLERQAFDAHMRITNGLTNITLQDMNLNENSSPRLQENLHVNLALETQGFK